MERETLEDGTLRLREKSLALTYTRLRPGVLLVRIIGFDRGELIQEEIEQLEAEVAAHAPLALLVDLRWAEGATKVVSDAWTEWFRTRKPQLREVHILVVSKYLDVTVNVAKLFSRTGELIQVYSDVSRFEAVAARLVPRLKQLPAPPP
jgi:hypothetical protein